MGGRVIEVRRRRRAPKQIVRNLPEADRTLAGGIELPEVCKALEISEGDLSSWRAQFDGMRADDVKRLSELERENAPLKRSR
jgi:putative transposase